MFLNVIESVTKSGITTITRLFSSIELMLYHSRNVFYFYLHNMPAIHALESNHPVECHVPGKPYAEQRASAFDTEHFGLFSEIKIHGSCLVVFLSIQMASQRSHEY